jgi:beta-lactamase superfamily II metal-dependent hydrolase
MHQDVKNNNFLVIILLLLNIILWNYYIIFNTNIYQKFFNTSIVQKTKKNGFLYINFYNNKYEKLIIIKTPTNKTVLIDTGADIRAKKILKYIKDEKIFFIDAIFLTNANPDNLNGIQKLLNSVSIGKIIDGVNNTNSPQYNYFRYFMKHHPEIMHIKSLQNKEIYIDPYLKFKTYYALDKNNNKISGSLFIYIEYKNNNFLFTSDNGYKEQYGLMQNWLLSNFAINKPNKNKQIDVFEYPYIDYKNSVLSEFIELIKPRYIIAGKKSLFKNRLIDMNVWNNFYISNIQVKYVGNILTLKSDGNNIEVYK